MSEVPGSNRPIWLSETTHPELSEKLKKGLEEIVDPEIGFNIIQLGLVRNVTIEDTKAIINMKIPKINNSKPQVNNETIIKPNAKVSIRKEMMKPFLLLSISALVE